MMLLINNGTYFYRWVLPVFHWIKNSILVYKNNQDENWFLHFMNNYYNLFAYSFIHSFVIPFHTLMKISRYCEENQKGFCNTLNRKYVQTKLKQKHSEQSFCAILKCLQSSPRLLEIVTFPDKCVELKNPWNFKVYGCAQFFYDDREQTYDNDLKDVLLNQNKCIFAFFLSFDFVFNANVRICCTLLCIAQIFLQTKKNQFFIWIIIKIIFSEHDAAYA